MYFGTLLMGYLSPYSVFPKRIHNCEQDKSLVIRFDATTLYFETTNCNKEINYCPFCGLDLSGVHLRFNKYKRETILR